jgi:hypothetical protein
MRWMRTVPPPPTKMPRWPSGRPKNADVRRARQFESAADDSAVQRGHERNGPACDGVEHLVPRVALALARRLHLTGRPRQRLAEVEPGAEVLAVAEQHGDLGLFTGAVHGRAQCIDHGLVDRVALVGAVQADHRDRSVQFVAHQFLVHVDVLIPA